MALRLFLLTVKRDVDTIYPQLAVKCEIISPHLLIIGLSTRLFEGTILAITTAFCFPSRKQRQKNNQEEKRGECMSFSPSSGKGSKIIHKRGKAGKEGIPPVREAVNVSVV